MSFMDKIDWPLLREQKNWLLHRASAGSVEAEGLLMLLDNLMDEAHARSIPGVFAPEPDEYIQGAPCPYSLELFGNRTPCNCSDEQRQQCALDV